MIDTTVKNVKSVVWIVKKYQLRVDLLSECIKIDKENNVIVSIDDNNEIYFMYIDNPTSAPSLYKTAINYIL